MIYAIKATEDGKRTCRFEDASIGHKRLVMVAMGYKGWITMSNLTTKLHLLEQSDDDQTREDFTGYWQDSDQIVLDLRWLEQKGLLALARYRVPNPGKPGKYRYAIERERGLHFHD